MQITNINYITLNVLPYIVFIMLGIFATFLEYLFGTKVGGIAERLLWSYWVFPLIIFYFSIDAGSQLTKLAIYIRGSLLSFSFLFIGIFIMLGFVQLRIKLGMPI